MEEEKDENQNEEDFEQDLDDVPNENEIAVNKRFWGHYTTKITTQRGLILPEGCLKTLRAWKADSVLLWRESYQTLSLFVLEMAEKIEAKYRSLVTEKIEKNIDPLKRAAIKKFFRILLSNRQLVAISVNGKITLSKDTLELLDAKPGNYLHLIGLNERLLIMNDRLYEKHYGKEVEKQYYKYGIKIHLLNF